MKGESLQAYFKRFNVGGTGVRGATDETLKGFLIGGLRVRTDFRKHLKGKEPFNLASLYVKGELKKMVEKSLEENEKGGSQSSIKQKSKKMN